MVNSLDGPHLPIWFLVHFYPVRILLKKIIERENGTFHEQNTWIRYISLIFNEASVNVYENDVIMEEL